MTTEMRNWAVVAAAMEANGATQSEMYRRAKALAEGQADPMPTSFPAAPFSISAAWSIQTFLLTRQNLRLNSFSF